MPPPKEKWAGELNLQETVNAILVSINTYLGMYN